MKSGFSPLEHFKCYGLNEEALIGGLWPGVFAACGCLDPFAVLMSDEGISLLRIPALPLFLSAITFVHLS